MSHPFPSLLNAAATLAFATFAGAAVSAAVRLAASMLALQVSIGALNDLVDAGIDSGHKPGKPLPRGVVRPGEAAVIAVAGLGLGLALSAVSGPATAGVAAAGVACGYTYDLRLSRTTWSWLPLALALPLVPIHAWLGATGAVPAGLVALVPAAVLAGLGLALGNGLADEDRDLAAGVRTAVVALGRGRAWLIHALALAAAVAILVGIGPGGAGEPWRPVATLLATALIAIGVVLLGGRGARSRERGWELEAVGVAGLAIACLTGLATG